ncbi:nucleotidyl transferase AbiEii/AbiGii toxin family protein [Micromonospora sp. NPDC048835]|uniref:nucleotidyl transferase AbiEii/AbiGii toxin family protein n=1 Tax=Micromonospora sp. NPDC048835 TaxID=3155147 RepID=UPI0033FE6136
MLPSHIKITRVALAAAGRFGFALAGGYAVRAHGMGNRLSGDVDLFTAWHLRASFPEAVDNVIKAVEEHQYAPSPHAKAPDPAGGFRGQSFSWRLAPSTRSHATRRR